jgi:hypothetical protein
MHVKRLASTAAIATCVGLSALTGAGIVNALPLDPPPPTPAPPGPAMTAPTSALPHSGPAGPKGGQPATQTPPP